MNTKTEDLAEYASKLANLPLTKNQNSKFNRQLAEIVTFVDRLKKVKTKKVEFREKTPSVFPNIKEREDIPKASLSQELVLSNAKKAKNGYFVVPAIFNGK